MKVFWEVWSYFVSDEETTICTTKLQVLELILKRLKEFCEIWSYFEFDEETMRFKGTSGISARINTEMIKGIWNHKIFRETGKYYAKSLGIFYKGIWYQKETLQLTIVDFQWLPSLTMAVSKPLNKPFIINRHFRIVV